MPDVEVLCVPANAFRFNVCIYDIKHEARKKEQEINVLKDKVQKTIARNLNSTSTASPSIPGGITILNPVPRSLYGKQHANDAEQLLKEVIDQQQTKEAEIVEENEHLRRTLYTVQVELEGLMKKHSTSKSTVPVSAKRNWTISVTVGEYGAMADILIYSLESLWTSF